MEFSKGANIEEVVVVPAKTKNSDQPSNEKTVTFDQPLRRSRSDGELVRRVSSLSELSNGSVRTNWQRLTETLMKKRNKNKFVQKENVISALFDYKKKRNKGRCANVRVLGRRLSCLFFGPMFYRHRFRFIIFLEVFVPICVCLFVLWAFTSGISWKKAYSERRAADSVAQKNEADFNARPTDQDIVIQKFTDNFADDHGRLYIAFSPSNDFTVPLMRDVISILKLNADNVQVFQENQHSTYGASGVDNPSEVLEHCLLHRVDKKAHRSPVGIDFTMDDIDNVTKLPHTFKYVIRTFDKLISETLESHPYVVPPRKVGLWYPPYVESGFVGLQFAIQKAFLTKVYTTLDTHLETLIQETKDPMEKLRISKHILHDPNDDSFPKIQFKLILTPNYFGKNIRQLISVTICLILCLSYMGLSYFIVRQIVIENQSGIKDFLSLYNMAKYLHWVIYFFHSLVFRTITALGIVGTLYIDFGDGPILTHSTWLIVYMIIFFHLMSLSSFNFLIATFMTSVTFSGIFSMSVCFFSFVFPYCLVKTELMSETANFAFALIFPNWALWNAMVDIVDYECDNVGVNWSNIHTFTHEKSQLTYLQCIMIFICGNTVYFLIAMTQDLLPNKKSNIQFTWFRCLQVDKSLHSEKFTKYLVLNEQKGFKCRRDKIHPSKSINSKEENDFQKPLIYEQPEVSCECLAKIRNLSKSYSHNNLVLDNVSLDFFSSEITVVLGPADSGKSTLIQCLAGIVEPTLGHITINGVDLYDKKSKVREYVGLCPQEVVLFNVLSVQEHLLLCYKLRGLSTKHARDYTDGLMELLRITNVKKHTPSALTNDEKRKLAIALCLVDKPSVILLDEPTNGLEPLTRHEIWNILKSLKLDGHTIVLSSSMMDEAEFLGDRIALLSHGKLICYGSPKYLKDRYDTGYYLRIIPNPAIFNLEAFQGLPKKYFNQILREAPEKTTFDLRNFLLVLPPNQASKYADFFDALEDSKEDLGIVTYGAQTISLSDIFIKISEAVSAETTVPDIYIRNQKSSLWADIPVAPKQPLCPTKEEQFKAMIRKLWLYGIGGNFYFFWQLIIPLALIWLTVWHTRVFVVPPPTPVEREFLLSKFPKAKVYFRLQGLISDELGWRTHIENLGDRGEEIKQVDEIDEVIGNDMDNDRKKNEFTIEKRMIALELRSAGYAEEEFWAYYSSGSLHSPPLILSIIGNIFLQAVIHKVEPPIKPFTIIVANTPLPSTFESDFDISCGSTCLMFGLIISFCIGFFITFLMTFPVHERKTGMKQLQFMTGLHPFTYWLAYYVFHFVLCLILSGLVVSIFVMDTTDIYAQPQVFGTLFLIFTLFLCWSGIPWIYYLTILIPTSWDTPIILAFMLHLCLSVVPMLILELGFNDPRDGFVIFLRYFFHLFPPYTLTSAIHIFFDIVSKRSICLSLPTVVHSMCSMDKTHSDEAHFSVDMKQIYNYMVKHDVNLAKCCERICKPTSSCSTMASFYTNIGDHLDQPRLLFCVVAFLFQGILYWTLLMLLESRYISDYWHNIILKFLRNKISAVRRDSPDIAEERKLVEEAIQNKKCPEGTLMVCQELTKSYTEHMIISDVNLELKKGGIVGLLGGSECGKSQVVKMIAGSVVPTHGIILIDSVNLQNNRTEFLRRLGYCPQGDAFFDNFTGNQMMELMGKLRGLPTSELPIHSKKWLQLLGLAEGANDRCSTYSKSMRRRLSGAMALIGGNLILLLDEPTRGLDSIATQRFWSVIQHLASQGHGVIFTSSNVAECEKNSTKILVLSEGNVQCIGPPTKLREKFSRGFTYLIRVCYNVLTPLEIVSSTVGRVYDLKNTVEKKLKKSILRDEQGNLLLYFLSGSKLTWGNTFRIAEEIQSEHKQIVENYTISQATLDDVFVLLTNKYKDMDMPRTMRSSFLGEISQSVAEIQALEEAKKGKNIED